MMLEANKGAKKSIKIYGWVNKRYASEKLEPISFSKHYQGRYNKSFSTFTRILANSKFMVDLSSLPMDGGGTQYTFLDAIYHNCALSSIDSGLKMWMLYIVTLKKIIIAMQYQMPKSYPSY
jgi:hypothetical protein